MRVLSGGHNREGFWYDPIKGGIGAWEDTPRWMFWKPTKRRLVIPSFHGKPLFEYQHPAFVAREILEKRYALEE